MNLNAEGVQTTVLIYRRPPNANSELVDEFENFLERGPLDSGFTIVTDPIQLEVDGREAVQVEVMRETKEEDLLPANALILATRAETGAVYIFAASAPASDWEEWSPIFKVMAASIKINE